MTGPVPLLNIAGLTMRFGGLLAVDQVSFTVAAGHITALIGPNGAGKTTVFNCITGFYTPSAGQVLLHGAQGTPPQPLQGLPSHRIARAGIARTFQNIRLFAGMSALENLLVAQHASLTGALPLSPAAFWRSPSFRAREAAAIDRARFWLDRTGLLDHADQPAGRLPYGAQRHLEIARAMCTTPRLLCLDEPAAGLNARESAALATLLRAIGRDHCPILLIEHDMSVVMGISDHVVVLDQGRLIAAGPPAAVRADRAVIAAYLGEPA